MPLYYEDTKVGDLYIGSTRIALAYNGRKLVYAKPITFNSSGTLVIPQFVNKIHVDCVASKGASNASAGGNGGRVQCNLSVTAGQTLYIVVGEIPASSTSASYNASDIRTSQDDLYSRIVVAGGGGSGASGNSYTAGGDGGGLIGQAASNTRPAGGGQGGTQTAGGVGGANIPWTSQNIAIGNNGSLGLGGNGIVHSAVSGAGGAGYYGGGSGAAGYTKDAGNAAGGGGGGSSYANENLCTNVIHTQGFNNGSGYVTISFMAED